MIGCLVWVIQGCYLASYYILHRWHRDYHHWLEMVQYLNRLVDMPSYRWPKKVLLWNRSLKTKGWADQVKHILEYTNMNCAELGEEKVDLDALKAWLLELYTDRLHLESYSMQKLWTFVEMYDREEPRSIIKANLQRNHRSLLSKLKVGILSLHLEAGRWKDTPLEERICYAWDEFNLENEYHFVIHCDAYKKTRTECLQEAVNKTELGIKGDEAEIVKQLLSPEAIRITGRYLETFSPDICPLF